MLINQLQHDNKVPLLMAADYERGLSMRLNGVTVFPHAMAFGAAGKPELAEQFGKIVAEESRAIGVEWNLFPVADVNSNPANPVINTRSFGEDPSPGRRDGKRLYSRSTQIWAADRGKALSRTWRYCD